MAASRVRRAHRMAAAASRVRCASHGRGAHRASGVRIAWPRRAKEPADRVCSSCMGSSRRNIGLFRLLFQDHLRADMRGEVLA
jgi:hypothetical protein